MIDNTQETIALITEKRPQTRHYLNDIDCGVTSSIPIIEIIQRSNIQTWNTGMKDRGITFKLSSRRRRPRVLGEITGQDQRERKGIVTLPTKKRR
jgi:hypothetical protein